MNNNEYMDIESIVLKDLKNDEGLSLKMYKCTSDKWTIGYGHNLESKGIPKVVAELLLEYDFKDAYREAMKLLPDNDYPVVVKIGLTEMVFQLGIGNTKTFKKFLSAIRNKDYATAIKEAIDSDWNEQTPNRVRRLTNMLSTLLP